jgi:hypothetical protein
MVSIRELIESDLGVTLEGDDFGLPVELIDSDGVEYTDLMGQVLLDTRGTDPDTGMPIVVGEPNVSLRISSLTRVPVAGERWIVKIPTVPSKTATLVPFLMSEVRPPELGGSIGFIKLFLQLAEQS